MKLEKKFTDFTEIIHYGDTIIRILKRHADYGLNTYILFYQEIVLYRTIDGGIKDDSYFSEWSHPGIDQLINYVDSKIENITVVNDKYRKIHFTW